MVGAGVVCMLLFGVFFVVAPIRPHPNSDAGSFTGGSRVFVQLMGIATGVWLIAVTVALLGHDLNALQVLFEAFLALYIVAGVGILAALARGPGRRGDAHPRDPGLRPQEPPRPPPSSIYYRHYR